MKHASTLLLIVMVGMASSAMSQENGVADESKPSSFQPVPLNDEWNNWLVGEWEVVSGESSVVDESGKVSTVELDGPGSGGYRVELGLNGQFLIMKSWAEPGEIEMTEELTHHFKETTKASDEDIERFLSMPYKSMQIQTIDPKTGEVIEYLFDSQRCIAEGRGRRQGNQEIIEWVWSATAQGATSVSILEKIDDNNFAYNHKYTLPNGNKMEDNIEFARNKETSESVTKVTSHAEDLTAVNQLAEDYAAAWAKGDPEPLLTCYADDAVVIMSHEDPIVGKEALRELYQYVLGAEKTEAEGGGMAAMAEAIGLDPEDYTFTTETGQRTTEVSGDLGYLWSTYATAATPKPGVAGEPIRDSGVTLLIVRRQQDGAWKVALMMATRGEHPQAGSQ